MSSCPVAGSVLGSAPQPEHIPWGMEVCVQGDAQLLADPSKSTPLSLSLTPWAHSLGSFDLRDMETAAFPASPIPCSLSLPAGDTGAPGEPQQPRRGPGLRVPRGQRELDGPPGFPPLLHRVLRGARQRLEVPLQGLHQRRRYPRWAGLVGCDPKWTPLQCKNPAATAQSARCTLPRAAACHLQ